MAQIRKYQPGGKTPNKIGVLTIDGKEYTGDGFIQHMREYGKTLNDKTRDQFGNIINALEAGENLQYDSDSDVLTGNVNWAGIRKSREDNLEQDRTRLGKFFGALNNGMEQNARYAVNALRDMTTYEEPKKESAPTESVKPEGKNIDWSKAINLSYIKDKDGKRVVSKLDNSYAVVRLNELTNLLSDDWSDNDTFKGYNDYARDAYKVYNVNDLQDIIDRINAGTWTDDDLLILKDFGIIDNNQQNSGLMKKNTVATTTKKSDVNNAAVTTNKNNDKEINNNYSVKDKPSITEEVIQSYEAARKTNQKILNDTVRREMRKKIVSPTSGRITGFKFNSNATKSNLEFLRQGALDEQLTKNKEQDTVIKYILPLFYSRDTSNITYKQQGGIIKAERGMSDAKWNYYYENPNEKWYTADTISQMQTPISITTNNKRRELTSGQSPFDWTKVSNFLKDRFNYENLNTASQIIDAITANHKVGKLKEQALRYMPMSRNVLQMSAPIYHEDTRGFDLRRQQLLNTQLPHTADAKLNAQWKRNLMGELDNINREKYSYLSNNRNQYNQLLNTIDNKNRELRVAESNAFIDRVAQRNMALAENQAGMIANDYKTFEQALKKDLYNWQQDRAIYDKFDAAEKQVEFLKKYETAATDWAKTHAATGNEVGQSDLQRYFAANPAIYDKYQTEVLAAKRASYRPKSMWSFKKGGKLSAEDHIKINRAKSQDHINENKYKTIDKAVQKLNDNVIKIFLNMMK